jgi:hypothetical protein
MLPMSSLVTYAGLCLSLLLAGCSEADVVPAAPEDTEAVPGGPGVQGVIADETLAPIANSPVLACMTHVCLFGKSDSEGLFAFDIEPPAELALKTPENLDATPRRGALLVPVRIQDSNRVDVGTLRVPNIPAGIPLAPPTDGLTRYAAGDGLELVFSRADLTPRLGDALADGAARRVPLEHVRELEGLGDERLVAVYALHPFAATCSEPIHVEAPSALPAGTPVRFRTLSELDGHLSKPASGSANGEVVQTDPGEGITELTWLVISTRGGQP